MPMMGLSASSMAPYGTWASPIQANTISEAGSSTEDIIVDDVTLELYLVEQRPLEGGRNAILAASTGKDIYDSSWNARSRVHEYGGSPAIAHNGIVYFSNIADGRVYKVEPSNHTVPVAVTPENGNYRYGDFTIHPVHDRWIVSILEDHSIDDTATGIKTSLVAINIETCTVRVLVSGADFYSEPRFSPNGSHLVWKEWNFPYMPHQASNLMLAKVSVTSDDPFPSVHSARLVSGNNQRVSAEPTWTPANELLFVTDQDAYLNPWIVRNIVNEASQGEPLSATVIKEEFGEPAWFFGLSSYAVYDARRVVFSAFRNGRSGLYITNLDTRAFTPLECPYVLIQHVRSMGPGKVVFVGKKADANPAVVQLEVDENLKPRFTVLRGNSELLFSKDLISMPRPMEVPVQPEGRTTHVIVYLPKNPAYSAGAKGELPPAVFNLHGGPNSMLDQALDWSKQFYTSRGWAWIDVNYNGSTGYGRNYMDQLSGHWGEVDVRDSVEALKELGKRGIIDAKRSAIRGRSGGGFTTLQTLSRTTDTFLCGTAWFPASDLIALHTACHKFQAQYIPGLVGATLEEGAELWKARSPFYQAEQIKAPVLIMQGSIDRVVPPTQTRHMAEVIEKHGGSVKYIEFDGEGHGWRKADSVQRSMTEEIAFYEKTLL